MPLIRQKIHSEYISLPFECHCAERKLAQSWFPLICVKLPFVPFTGRSGELMNVIAGGRLITLLDMSFCPIGQYPVGILLWLFKIYNSRTHSSPYNVWKGRKYRAELCDQQLLLFVH